MWNKNYLLRVVFTENFLRVKMLLLFCNAYYTLYLLGFVFDYTIFVLS